MTSEPPEVPAAANSLEDHLAGRTTMQPLATEVDEALAAHLRLWLRDALPSHREIYDEVLYLNRFPPQADILDFLGRVGDSSLPDLVHQYISLVWKRRNGSGSYPGNHDAHLLALARLLNTWGFHLIPSQQGLQYRVEPAVVQVVETAAGEAVRAGRPTAAERLGEAWRLAYGMEPHPSRSVQESIAAVEAVLLHVVVPDDTRAIYSRAVGELKARQANWRLAIVTDRGDDSVDPLIVMLDRLGMAHVDRHEGVEERDPVTLESARACVHLAATLVQWLASGAVQRRS